jgi:hypothetical protein
MATTDFRGRIERHPLASFFRAGLHRELAWHPEMLGYRADLNQSLSTIAQFGAGRARPRRHHPPRRPGLRPYSGAVIRANGREKLARRLRTWTTFRSVASETCGS